MAIVYLLVEQPDAEMTKKVVETEGRRAPLIPGDVTDSARCTGAVERTVEVFGSSTSWSTALRWAAMTKSSTKSWDGRTARTFSHIYK